MCFFLCRLNPRIYFLKMCVNKQEKGAFKDFSILTFCLKKYMEILEGETKGLPNTYCFFITSL